MWQRKIQKLLESSLKSGSGLTIRSFARKSGLSAGTISEIASGKRTLTESTGRKIVAALPLDKTVKATLLRAIDNSHGSSRILLQEQAYEIISRWYFYAIISLFELDEPPRDENEVAKFLQIPLSAAKEALDKLETFGLLERSGNWFSSSGRSWTTSDGLCSQTIRAAHRSEIDLSLTALEDLSVDLRDYTSVTFSASEGQLKEAKSEIRRFRDRLTKLMSKKSLDQVYKLNIQLFPVVKKGFDAEKNCN